MNIDFLKKFKPDGLKNFFRGGFFSRRCFVFGLVSVVFLVVLFFGVSLTYGILYKDKIYHGVYLNGYSLGGLTSGELTDFLQNLEKRIKEEGINYVFVEQGEEKNIKIDIATVSEDNPFDLASWDAESLSTEAKSIGKSGSFFAKIWQPYALLLNKKNLTVRVTLVDDKLQTLLKEKLSPFEVKPKNAEIAVVGMSPIKFNIIAEKTGEIFDYEDIVSRTKNALSVFSWQKIVLNKEIVNPTVLSGDIGDWVNQNLSAVLDFGNLAFIFDNGKYEENYSWKIKKDVLLDWVQPQKDENNNLFLNISESKFAEYFQNNITTVINRPAQNPKFSMVDGDVEELRGGVDGREVDLSATYAAVTEEYKKVNSGDKTATSTIPVVIISTPPDQKLSELNNLGISDIIGVGISHFKNSHSNRIKNIANAVRILNGTVIAPGEEFSTNASAGPFTLENKYLPEEVIKGDQIVKEIAGGMCQIGTTLFRMAMNSGMPITERRNHSLVVSYYADPVNGNPGTDATVYEPILDFKFLNDTGNYLLIQTEMDTEKEELRFTLWGKPDGRSGSYTHPIVSQWISSGPARTVESTTMAPGEKKCQNAFPGAVASFTYTRVTPNGETIERVFDSRYRALAAICWVGVEKKIEEIPTTECTGDNCPENSLPENTNDSIIESNTEETAIE